MLAPIKQMGLRIGGFIGEIVGLATSRERLGQLWRVSLYSNAVYLMLANAASALLTFGFWIMVARFYSLEDVGIASAIIAAAGLLAVLSYGGLGAGLIRFLPGAGVNARLMINTVFTVGVVASIIASLIFAAGLGLWSPTLLFLRGSPIYLTAFVLFAIAANLWTLAQETLIAVRRTGFVLAQNLIFGLLRIILPIPLAAFFHSFGIFASWSVSLGVAFLVTVFLFIPRVVTGYRPSPAFRPGILKGILRFSLANYLSMLFITAPGLILPIMVLNLRGAEENAYFYIAWAVAAVLNMIPNGPAFSLFAEGSYDDKTLRLNARRALKMTYLILAPAVVLTLAIADKLLLLFGDLYSQNGTTLFRILAISALPHAINVIYLGINRVQKNLRVIVSLPIFLAAVTLVLSYILLPRMGINGVGIASLISQTFIALMIVIIWLKGRRGLPYFQNGQNES